MLKISFLPFALLVLSQAANAQQPPNAGSQLQQIPPAPTPQETVPTIGIETVPTPAAPESDAVKILVNRLRVTGATVYPEGQLLVVTGFQPRSELNLAELRAMAQKITNHYRSQGYFVAQAFLPAQESHDGTVTIAVIEGRFGRIDVRNQSTLADARIQRQLSGLTSGEPIQIDPLETRLLQLSDIPGVKVTSTLTPGASLGMSDLIVDVVPADRVAGSMDTDNAGNRYTGEYRLGATVNLNNPAGVGDVASLRALTSGPGLSYARASYQVPLGRAAVGVAYSGLNYELAEEFAFAQATGTARIASIYGSHPLIRTRNSRLYAGLAFDAKTFQDKRPLNLDMPVEDKQAQVWMASLRGEHRDQLGGGGMTGLSLTWSTGNIDLQTPGLVAADAPAQSGGHFNKLGLGVSRLQSVTDTVSLYAAFNGQWASKNLDASEKMALGGLYGVRAYPEGEAYADQGYMATLEARVQLPKPDRLPGQVQLIGFVDSGSVTTQKNPWSDAVPNSRTLHGAGVGLNWSDTNDFAVRAYYARKLGNEVATSAPDESGRFWIQAIKYF